MTQQERREYLIQYLLNEKPEYKDITMPHVEQAQKNLLRALMNVRMPDPISEDFLKIQDEYLQEENRKIGIVDINSLKPTKDGRIILWQGDITRLKVDGIVNAANSQMLGCFQPGHSCIDNIIHTRSGIQLRLKCEEIMKEQGHEEPTGQAKITPAYNLPCNYVIHTVGPIVMGPLNDEHERLLASCYTSILNLADQNGLESVAFCCISTGVFMFPQDRAANIAVKTVHEWLDTHPDTKMKKIIFNVFKDEDFSLYQAILNA